jgi:purine-nucleoside phosphorylase
MPSSLRNEFSITDYDLTADFIRQHTRYSPELALILGSGLGSLADSIESADTIPSQTIPNWPLSTVVGHSGRLVIGLMEGRPILVMQGRAHFYEGYTMAAVTLPIRVLHRLGVRTLFVTNAAGGIDPAYAPGDLMLIQDHLNLPGMAGNNPLRGPNEEAFGPRFPGMTNAYDRALRRLARSVAQEDNIPLHEGVYCYLAGPTFESPAEIRMLRTWGAQAVGMSTAPEVVVAVHAGMRVLGVSGISNSCVSDPDSDENPNHEEVLEAGQAIAPRLTKLLRGVLRRLDEVN